MNSINLFIIIFISLSIQANTYLQYAKVVELMNARVNKNSSQTIKTLDKIIDNKNYDSSFSAYDYKPINKILCVSSNESIFQTSARHIYHYFV